MSKDIIRRASERLLAALLNTALWVALLLATFMALFWLVRLHMDAAWLRALGGTAHWVAEGVVRLGVLALIAFLLLLLIHPLRTRWWAVGHVRRALALLRRKAPARAPAPPPAAAPFDPLPAWLRPATAPRPMSRRRFLTEAALLGGTVGYATLIEPATIETLAVRMPVRDLPERFIGMRIAQVSDLHINAYTTRANVERAVARINAAQPDIVMITGDFVDWSARYAEDATAPFRAITAPEGVFAVLGNHDYYSGDIEAVKRAIRAAGIGLLVNQHTVLRRGGDSLPLVGLDDPRHNRGSGIRLSQESIDPERALRGIPAGANLLMVHNPIIVPLLVRTYAPSVILCGHTHGGQFQVPILTNHLVREAEYFVHGRYDLGPTQLYVNRGLGFTGPPVRFRAAPEITLMTLERA